LLYVRDEPAHPPEPVSEGAGDLGKPLRPEHDQPDEGDHDELGKPDIEHGGSARGAAQAWRFSLAVTSASTTRPPSWSCLGSPASSPLFSPSSRIAVLKL